MPGRRSFHTHLHHLHWKTRFLVEGQLVCSSYFDMFVIAHRKLYWHSPWYFRYANDIIRSTMILLNNLSIVINRENFNWFIPIAVWVENLILMCFVNCQLIKRKCWSKWTIWLRCWANWWILLWNIMKVYPENKIILKAKLIFRREVYKKEKTRFSILNKFYDSLFRKNRKNEQAPHHSYNRNGLLCDRLIQRFPSSV